MLSPFQQFYNLSYFPSDVIFRYFSSNFIPCPTLIRTSHVVTFPAILYFVLLPFGRHISLLFQQLPTFRCPTPLRTSYIVTFPTNSYLVLLPFGRPVSLPFQQLQPSDVPLPFGCLLTSYLTINFS